jgi:molybdate transport repressor ModE-like protein
VLNARLLARARLRHLQLLVAIADHGTLKRAADAVGMSQPAATQALVELERLIGMPLFQREARGMRSTAAGTVVLPVVRQILQALRDSMESLAAISAGIGGVLRLGTIPAASLALVSDCLRWVGQRCPKHEVVVVEGTPRHLLEELAAGSLQLLVIRELAELGKRFELEPLLEDCSVVVAGVGHPLAGRATLSREDLLQYPWMRAPRGVMVRDQMDELFESAGAAVQLHPVSTTSPMVIFGMLSDNRTLTLGPASVADWFVRQGLAITLPLPVSMPLGRLGAVYPAGTEREPALAAVLGLLRECARNSARVGHDHASTPHPSAEPWTLPDPT